MRCAEGTRRGGGRVGTYLEPVHDDDLAVGANSDLVACFDPPSILEQVSGSTAQHRVGTSVPVDERLFRPIRDVSANGSSDTRHK